MERPRLGPSERRAAVALIDPNEQITLQAGSDTKPRRTVLAADFRTADFVSEPKGYRARNRKFEFSRESCELSVPLSIPASAAACTRGLPIVRHLIGGDPQDSGGKAVEVGATATEVRPAVLSDQLRILTSPLRKSLKIYRGFAAAF
jgi:hypothetical protein